jgi:anti-sigma regulatory factor (Ser/Thr protein kinase)
MGMSSAVRDASDLVLDLPPELASVSRARAKLAQSAGEWGCPTEVIEDACLVLTELLSNGVLHARTSLRAVVAPQDGGIRVEVHDGSPLPVLPRPTGGAQDDDWFAATGRGLAIVAALARSWGCTRATSQGKVVWAEIGPTLTKSAQARKRRPGRTAHGLQPICLAAVPLRLLRASEEHLEDLFRELQVATTGTGVPASIARLAARAEGVKERLAPVREPARRALWEASQRGQSVVDLDVVADSGLPEALKLCSKFLASAKWAARAGHLLTEPPEPEVDAWRNWLKLEVESQFSGRPHRVCPFPP